MIQHWRSRLPGLSLAVLVAMAAQFLSEHYGAPAMLMALLIGLALNFLSEEARMLPGLDWAARGLLRLGVALLGLRITTDLVTQLGLPAIGLTMLGVAVTIGAGLVLAPLFRADRSFGFLTGGAVAICGASAALALGALLPRGPKSERDIAFAVVGVTLLSTLAMIAYPIVATRLGFDERLAGLFLGGTIHDVAQVVGAGFSVSEGTGEVATLVKLLRVALLAPVVLVAALVLRRAGSEGPRPPLMPVFVVGFLVLAALNSAGLVPAPVVEAAAAASRWFLLAAVAAVGMKTSLPQVLRVGPAAIGLLATESAILAGLFLAVLVWVPLG